MDYKENKIRIIFNWIYIVIFTHILWVAGFIVGLGIFGVIPTTITTFEIVKEASDEYTRPRLKIMKFWWKNYKKNFKKYALMSGLFSLFEWILLINYSFLNTQTNFITYIVFYVTIFLFILSLILLLWFSFIAAYYPNMNLKEKAQNTISFPFSHAVEMIILYTILGTLYYLLWTWTPGLVLFTGFGGLVVASSWTFMKIHDGYGIHKLFQGWHHQY